MSESAIAIFLESLCRRSGFYFCTEENPNREPAERWSCEIMDSVPNLIPFENGYVCGFGASIHQATISAFEKLLEPQKDE